LSLGFPGKTGLISDRFSDLHAVNGDWPLDTKLPLVGGHEGAGIVVLRGELVRDIAIGDHVGVQVRKKTDPSYQNPIS